MCYFILLDADESLLQSHASRLPGDVVLEENPYEPLSSNQPERKIRCVTSGGCSCDLVGKDRESETRKLRRNYEKKGWSRTKVERALADHKARSSGLPEEFLRWLADLADVGAAPRVFVHWDSSPIPDTVPVVHGTSLELREGKLHLVPEHWLVIK